MCKGAILDKHYIYTDLLKKNVTLIGFKTIDAMGR